MMAGSLTDNKPRCTWCGTRGRLRPMVTGNSCVSGFPSRKASRVLARRARSRLFASMLTRRLDSGESSDTCSKVPLPLPLLRTYRAVVSRKRADLLTTKYVCFLMYRDWPAVGVFDSCTRTRTASTSAAEVLDRHLRAERRCINQARSLQAAASSGWESTIGTRPPPPTRNPPPHHYTTSPHHITLHISLLPSLARTSSARSWAIYNLI